MEIWACDRSFREDLLVDSRAAAAARGFAFDPDELRAFWDKNCRPLDADVPTAELLGKITTLGLIWIELQQRNKDYVANARKANPDDPRFAAWRQRQIARCSLSFHPHLGEAIPHIPFAIELSKGCSVGCWFCGVSAPKFDENFPYSDANAPSFRMILQALARVTGRSAGKWGILYYATDPLDHADYELFCRDFMEEFGTVPATTTARGWQDLSRTRNIIRLAARYGQARVRLSVLTKKVLYRYLSNLSASELAEVSFVPVNKESVSPPSHAGRARLKPPSALGSQPSTTISCLSGFLINLVEQTVRLISPCPSTDQWPNGYFVHDQRRYQHASEFAAVLEDMMKRNMHLSPRAERRLCFSSDLVYRQTENGFRLSGETCTRAFDGIGALREIGDLICSGQHGTLQIAAEMEARHCVPQDTTLSLIDDVYQAGVLAEGAA